MTVNFVYYCNEQILLHKSCCRRRGLLSTSECCCRCRGRDRRCREVIVDVVGGIIDVGMSWRCRGRDRQCRLQLSISGEGSSMSGWVVNIVAGIYHNLNLRFVQFWQKNDFYYVLSIYCAGVVAMATIHSDTQARRTLLTLFCKMLNSCVRSFVALRNAEQVQFWEQIPFFNRLCTDFKRVLFLLASACQMAS